MRRRILGVVLMLAVSGFIGATAQGQEQKQEQAEQRQQEAPPAAKDVILRFTQNVGDKLGTAAEEFPEELYEYRPGEGARTFAEILLHVARSNDLIVSRIAQRPPSDSWRGCRFISFGSTSSRGSAKEFSHETSCGVQPAGLNVLRPGERVSFAEAS